MKKKDIKALFLQFCGKVGLKEDSTEVVEFLNTAFPPKEPKVVKHYLMTANEQDFIEFCQAYLDKGVTFEQLDDEGVQDTIYWFMRDYDYLPSFSFDKGDSPDTEEGEEYFIKVRDKIYAFTVHEGDAVEISWSHSIYETDIKNFALVPESDYEKYNFVEYTHY